jgi:hypothetical protein
MAGLLYPLSSAHCLITLGGNGLSLSACTCGRGVRCDATCFFVASAGSFPRYALYSAGAVNVNPTILLESRERGMAACIPSVAGFRRQAVHVCRKRPCLYKPVLDNALNSGTAPERAAPWRWYDPVH